MSFQATEIEAIVRAVLQQLQVSPSAARSSGSPIAEALPEPIATNTLEVTERIVTMETLRNRLQGIECVRVVPRAIITPLVRDLFRSSGIRCETLSTNGSSNARGLCVAWYVDDASNDSLGQQISSAVPRSVEIAMANNVHELQQMVGAGNRCDCGVIGTRRAASLMWQLSQQRTYPVAQVHAASQIASIWEQVRPRLIVVDLSTCSSIELPMIVLQYTSLATANGW